MVGYGSRAVEIGRDHPSVIRGGVREGCDAGHVATGPHMLLAADAAGLVDLDSAWAWLDADALQPNVRTRLAPRSDEDVIHHQIGKASCRERGEISVVDPQLTPKK